MYVFQQFKKRYFVLKQESDFTFSLQFYKDEKKTDAKGAIFMDLAVEARPVKPHFCFFDRFINKLCVDGRNEDLLNTPKQCSSLGFETHPGICVNLVEVKCCSQIINGSKMGNSNFRINVQIS
jgi:hypothetical protein